MSCVESVEDMRDLCQLHYFTLTGNYISRYIPLRSLTMTCRSEAKTDTVSSTSGADHYNPMNYCQSCGLAQISPVLKPTSRVLKPTKSSHSKENAPAKEREKESGSLPLSPSLLRRGSFDTRKRLGQVHQSCNLSTTPCKTEASETIGR